MEEIESQSDNNSKVNNIAPTVASNSGYLSSPPQSEAAVRAARNVSARSVLGDSVVWKDLTVVIKGKRKYSDRVIRSSDGYALSGTMTVIMGPRKSGKSTLLQALAGRLDGSANMYGEVFVNGAKSSLNYGSYGFVTRKNTLIGSLTVREYLYYSALLQLPGFLCDKKSALEDAIDAMSLGDYANHLIGDHCFTKGLSHGEKRRVSIARELVMGPRFLFIDEPLYHLDSVSALMMMVTLKKLANTGSTLIFTIYQSSTEVFGLFDRICHLSNGKTLEKHWLAYRMIMKIFHLTLEETYKSSADAAEVKTMILRLTEREGPSLKSKGKSSSETRIIVLTLRSLLIMSREWKYYWFRLILYMLITLCIGTLFSGLGHSLTSVGARVAAIFIFISFGSLLSILGVPAQLKEIKVFECEDSNEHSGAFVFLTGQFLASIPFLLLISISSSLLFYFLIGLRNDFGYLMYFVVSFFICLLVNEGLVLVVVTILQDIFWSIVVLLFMHVMMLSAGYFRIRSALPGPVWMYPMAYIAFHTLTIQGMLENEYNGILYTVGQVRTISAYEALYNVYDVSPNDHSKWKNVMILSLIAIGYRVLVFLLLQIHVKKFSVFGFLYCKRKINDKT